MFAERVDLSGARVRAYEGFVLLCGGDRDANAVPVKSIRHRIYSELTSGTHSILAAKVKLPEDIKGWAEEGHYRDLLEFEEHLAGLSAVVVLVVETPGSIAELGAFSIINAFSDRMLVIVAEHHYETDSFIRHGPVKKLENGASDSVLVYDWHDSGYSGPRENFAKIESDIPDIIDAIKRFTSNGRGERSFKKDDPSHVMLLIGELCHLFGVVNESEIISYLKVMGLNVSHKEVAAYLFILKSVGLIHVKSKGHGRYFYVENWDTRIVFSYIQDDKPQLNRERIQADVADYYSKHQKTKFEVLQKVRAARS